MVEIEDSSDDDFDSEGKKKLLQQEKEEFMRKMGIVKEKREQKAKLQYELVSGGPVDIKEKRQSSVALAL